MATAKGNLKFLQRTARTVLVQYRDHSKGGIERGERSLDLVSKDGRGRRRRGISEASRNLRGGESGKAELELSLLVR